MLVVASEGAGAARCGVVRAGGVAVVDGDGVEVF